MHEHSHGHEHGQPNGPDLTEVVAPRHTALVVVDMQNAFTDPRDYPQAEEMFPRLRYAIERAREAGVRVVFTRMVQDEGTMSPVWRSLPHSHGHHGGHAVDADDFHPSFQPSPADLVITKHRYSAFVGTDLELRLRAAEIKTVVMTGIATNICVETTARDAYQRDFFVVTLEDCCAAREEVLHNVALQNLGHAFGRVANSNQVTEAWQMAAPAPAAHPSGSLASRLASHH
jgi:ureidoacrylate peracid hydrolase